MSRRGVLWIAFVCAHLLVTAEGWARGRAAAGDVDQVYRGWADAVASGGSVLGVAQDWVYPILAWVPILLAKALAVLIDYTLAWAAVVTAFDAAAFAILVGRGRSAGRARAAWFWLAALVALGGVGMFRLDGFTVPLAIAGGLWLVSRPWVASVLLTLAMWIKIWPVALLAAGAIAARRRLAIVGGATVTTAVVVLTVVLAGGTAHVFGFLRAHGDRGLQMEAPAATLHVWLAMLGRAGAGVLFNREIVTMEVTGPATETLAALMTPLLVVAVGAIAVVGVVKVVRGARYAGLFPALSLALVLALIVFNKVGSPQFMAWLIPPIVVAIVLDRRGWVRPAILALVVLALTHAVFPWTFGALIALEPLPVVLLTLRNVLVVALLVCAVVRLVRVPVRGPAMAGADRT